jgi:threonine dehydrogenase-like Zn-dependent dehydrogenase
VAPGHSVDDPPVGLPVLLVPSSNPNAGIAEKMFGHPVAGIFGYSHLTGGFAGGQAQYARVPFADVGSTPFPEPGIAIFLPC